MSKAYAADWASSTFNLFEIEIAIEQSSCWSQHHPGGRFSPFFLSAAVTSQRFLRVGYLPVFVPDLFGLYLHYSSHNSSSRAR